MNAILLRIGDLWATEPVAITALFTAIVDCAIAFGLPITADQKTALIAVVSTLGVLIARGQVTPPAHLPEPPVPVMSATIQGAK